MVILRFKRPHHLGKLHEELLAAVSALRPVPGPDGIPTARLLLSGDGENIEAIVPDDLTQQDIAAIEQAINVHDPAPPPPPPDPTEALAQAIERARSWDEARLALAEAIRRRRLAILDTHSGV